MYKVLFVSPLNLSLSAFVKLGTVTQSTTLSQSAYFPASLEMPIHYGRFLCARLLRSSPLQTSKAAWEGPKEIKLEYPSASFLADNRVVFNIKGNHYRLIVRINYDYQMIWIRFVGTHAEYDKINAKTI